MSREDLLSGKLVLRVRRGDLTNEIVIFENGAFAPGWEAMSGDGRVPGEIYFGFTSTTTFLTAPDDELEVELLVLKDLAGIGVRQTGVLAAGTYRAKGTYFGLQDDFDSSQPMLAAQMIDSLTEQGVTREEAEVIAQMMQGVSLAMRMNAEAFSFFASTGCWDNLWPLKITSNEGWASPEQVAFQERMLEIEKVAIEREGEPGWNCSGPA
jgi:roadblock/LC7 domain-containing protein